MDMNKFTQKSIEILSSAKNMAEEYGQQEI